MDRTTTLIATVGSGFDRVTERVAEAAENIAREVAPEPTESLPDWVERARAKWQVALRRPTIYTILTRDPLGPVVREWSRRLEGHHSDLELAIGLVGDAPLPDFYLVDPAIAGQSAHWYLDHLAKLAPRRVVLITPSEPAVFGAIRRLPYGKALPTTAEVAASARTYVPVPSLDPQAETTLLT